MPHTAALIATTLNCRSELERSLRSICREDNLERVEELVVVDGGSDDGTVELLSDWARRVPSLRHVVSPGANISRGRNQAIESTRCEIIVCWDTGCEYPAGYVPGMLQPFDDPRVDVVGARTIATGETPYERSLVRFYDRREASDRTNPSHRAIAYRRTVWTRVGGYPEQVEAGEDSWFNARWHALGLHYELSPRAEVRWRVRGDWASTARMARRNARGHFTLRVGAGRRILLTVTALYTSLVPAIVAAAWSALPLGCWVVGYAGYVAYRLSRGGRWRGLVSPRDWFYGWAAMSALDVGTTVGVCQGLIAGRFGRIRSAVTARGGSLRRGSR
ncbi:MAG TPA: glycosyltransferase [Candidatus Polarisedimenticolaceae bacterium]|nr:glycosyltransferase [Candidatus Polarisedimenticolaceae bacterium]